MIIWMVFLGLMTYVFIREGGFHQFDPQWEITLLAGFWFFGVSATGYFLSQPVTRLEIANEKINLTETWLFKKEFHQLQKADIKELYIKTHLNSDGDSHELFLVTTKKEFPIKQSSELKEMEELKQTLQKLI